MLKQKIILSYYSKIVAQIFQVAATVIVARIAGASVLGTVAFGVAYVSMFIFISDLGLGTAHIKLVSEGRDEASCNATFIRVQTIQIIVFFVFVLGFFLFQKYTLGYGFESPVHEQVILVTLIAVTLSRGQLIFKTCFMAKTEQAKQDVLDFAELVVYQLLRVAVVLLGYQALALAFSKLVAALLVIPFYLYLFKDFPVGRFDRNLLKEYVSISLPLIIIVFADSLTTHFDKVLLQYFTNSTEVGYYIAGFRVGAFISLVGYSVGLLLFPSFSRAISQKDYNGINGIIRKFEKFSLTYIFPVTVIMSIYSDTIVHLLLGNQFEKTIPILSIINITAFLLTLFTPYGNVLAGSGEFKIIAKIYCVHLLLFILAAVVTLSPNLLNLSGFGLALSLFFSNLLRGCLFIFFVRMKIKRIRILPAFRLLVFGTLISLAAGYAYWHLRMAPYQKALFALTYFCVYWGLGAIFKLIDRQDWEMLTELVRIKKLSDYIKSEISHTDHRDRRKEE
ncbi:MAG: oligosaccharide flippase family protein [Candidatus Omnitrophota bacterium]